jgi:hypothetical protein
MCFAAAGGNELVHKSAQIPDSLGARPLSRKTIDLVLLAAIRTAQTERNNPTNENYEQQLTLFFLIVSYVVYSEHCNRYNYVIAM